MKSVLVWLSFGFLLLANNLQADTETTGGKKYTYFNTRWPTFDVFTNRTALANVGYECKHSLVSKGYQTVILIDVKTYLGDYGGLLLFEGHGLAGYVAIRTYPHTTAGYNQAVIDQDFAIEAGTFSEGDLSVRDIAGDYAICLTTQGINNKADGDNAIALIAACYSSGTGGTWGGRVKIGYAGSVESSVAQTEMTALLNNLTGANGPSYMSTATGSQANQVVNGDPTALIPYVAATEQPGYMLSDTLNTITVTFGTKMSRVSDPIIIGGVAVKRWCGWLDDYRCRLRFYCGWETGEVIAGLDAIRIASSKGINLLQDVVYTYYCTLSGYPPAASVEAFTPVLANGGVLIQVDLSQMRGSKSFWITKQDGSLVGDTISVRNLSDHTFEVFDPSGNETDRYYLYERDHRGVFLRAMEGVYGKRPEVTRAGAVSNPERIMQELQSRFNVETASSSNYSAVIICPDSFVSTAQILANFWNARGRSVMIAPLSVTGSTREAIKAYLQGFYGQGGRYAILAGSADDHEWFDDPSKWPDLPGEDDWRYWYEDYHTPGGYYYFVSHPERDLVPTWYFPDTLYDNMSYWTPYYSGDWYYGDGLSDLRLGRFPAANRSQLLAMINKDIWYIEHSASSWQSNISVWGFCQSFDGNDGPLMKAMLVDFLDRIPSSMTKHSLLDTSWTYAQREQAGLTDWNAGRGIIWMQGTSSTCYKMNHFFSKSGGWNIGKLAVDKLPLVIGANCGIGAYDMAQNPTYGEPVAQELLGSNAYRGAWAVIAPSRGTWIEGDRQICNALNTYICSDPVQDLGTAWMLALREVRDGNQRQCGESFNLLGDPMAPLPMGTVTSVEGQTPRETYFTVFPNPFNPAITIEYFLPQSCFVDLSIYNVAGQRICSLIERNEMAGRHRVIWQGKEVNGKMVASGVYFCGLKVGSLSQTRKVILLR